MQGRPDIFCCFLVYFMTLYELQIICCVENEMTAVINSESIRTLDGMVVGCVKLPLSEHLFYDIKTIKHQSR